MNGRKKKILFVITKSNWGGTPRKPTPIAGLTGSTTAISLSANRMKNEAVHFSFLLRSFLAAFLHGETTFPRPPSFAPPNTHINYAK